MTGPTRVTIIAAIAATLATLAGGGWLFSETLSADLAESRERLVTIRGHHRDAIARAGATAVSLDPRLFFAEASPGIAAASLQSHVLAIAGHSDIRVTSVAARSMDSSDSPTDGGVGTLAVDLVAVASTPALRTFLHLVETSAPLMIVERLAVSARQASSVTIDTASRMRTLDIEIRIVAAIAPPAREGS